MNETNDLLRQIRDLLLFREVCAMSQITSRAKSPEDIVKGTCADGTIFETLTIEAATRATIDDLGSVRIEFEKLTGGDSGS